MDSSGTPGPASLVVTSGPQTGRRIILDRDEVVIGRAVSSDVRFDDPGVSRTHAVLRSQNGGVYLSDAGSTSGTFVQRERVTSPRRLVPGDVITMSQLHLRFEGVPNASDETRIITALEADPPARQAGAVRYDVGSQSAGVINMAGRDQFVIQQRENFFRDIAATKTKARYLIVLGFVLVAGGFALFAGGLLSFLSSIPDLGDMGSGSGPTVPSPFGNKILGVPSGLLGWVMAAIGSFMLIVGIVLHVVATSRRRRIDRELPDPRWQRRQW